MATPTLHTYRNREEKAAFIVQRFRSYLNGEILDVGGDARQLRTALPAGWSGRYINLDRSGSSDVVVDLEAGRLPLEDRAFATVVCCDVLEHLDHLHAVFGELVRVARQYLIISLPNNWSTLLPLLRQGYGTPKHYGLPLDNPPDRHRWFFNYDDALEFSRNQAKRWHLTIVEQFGLVPPPSVWWKAPYYGLRPWLVRFAYFRNRCYTNLWVVFKKGT